MSFWASSGVHSLAGTLPLRCAARSLAGDLAVACFMFLSGYCSCWCCAIVYGAGHEVHWVSGSGPGRKRIRLNRKTPAHRCKSPSVRKTRRKEKKDRARGAETERKDRFEADGE